jgi:hypothetical protein
MAIINRALPQRGFSFNSDENDYIDMGGSVDGFDTSIGDCAAIFDVQSAVEMGNKNTQNFLLNNTWSTNNNGINFSIEDTTASNHGRVSFLVKNGGTGYGGSSDPNKYPNDKARHLVGFSISGSTATIYVDGEVVATWTVTMPSTTDFYTRIGNNIRSWNGRMYRAALWSSAKDWSDMIGFHSTNLEVYYEMDESSGSTANDSSGNSNDGIIYNHNTASFFFEAPTVNNAGASFFGEMYDRAFNFGRVSPTDYVGDNYIDCGGSVANLDGAMGDCAAIFKVQFFDAFEQRNSNWHLCATTATHTNGMFFRIRDHPTSGSVIRTVEWYTTVAGVYYGGSSPGYSVPDDQEPFWIGFSLSGSTATIYVDGTVIDTQTGITKPTTTDRNFEIGIGGGSTSWVGMMFEAATWRSAKTWTEMRSFDTTNLELWYKMNETSGTSVTDSSGVGNTGTLNNTDADEFFVNGGMFTPQPDNTMHIDGDKSLTFAHPYRTQIYDLALEVAENKQAMWDLNSRLLIHKNDPT